jgi:hypothetical protein|tara:strand:- start:601 stop:861 length:261 start_codon:yes stop_codon:yes gene_type:complete
MATKRKRKTTRKRSYFGRKAKATQSLEKDLVKQARLDPRKDIKVAESVLLMLDEIDRDSRYNDEYSLGYREGLKKSIRIIRKVYAS